ncbi:MAG: YkyA family protein [Aerococcaceae bacterium]|nr:YkyA family protein [Aerococcaceae bacterium]
MKKRRSWLALWICILFVVACGQHAVNRAENAIGLMQEDLSKIVNELREIQTLEKGLQSAFETVLSANDTALFASEDNAVANNLNERTAHIKTLEETQKSLVELSEELANIQQQDLPTEQFKQVHQEVQALNTTLTTYIGDYRNNLAMEAASFKAMANPESDYTVLFSIIKNLSNTDTTNNINLDKVLPSFEPISIKLINLKVQLVNMKER